MIEVIKNEIILGEGGVAMATDFFFETKGADKPVIIYTHGFNGFKDWGHFDLLATHFAEAGFFLVKYNLSHNGTTLSQGQDFVDLERYRRNNYTIELNDLKAVIETISHPLFQYLSVIDPDKIYLLGHSRGGAISIIGAQDARVKALVTWASIAECTSPWSRFTLEELTEWKATGTFYYENKRTNQQMPIDYQIYEDYLLHREEYDLLKIVRELTKPMLFIHGKQDPAVPYQAAQLLHQANTGHSQLILCDGDHVFGRKHPWPHDYLPEQTKFVVDETISFLKSVSK